MVSRSSADLFSSGPGGANDVTPFTQAYGDLTNVLFGNQGSNTRNGRLTADAGLGVLLYGFDLAGWLERDHWTSAVRVLDGGAHLVSQADVFTPGCDVAPRARRSPGPSR